MSPGRQRTRHTASHSTASRMPPAGLEVRLDYNSLIEQTAVPHCRSNARQDMDNSISDLVCRDDTNSAWAADL
jgi:hypothetical protein